MNQRSTRGVNHQPACPCLQFVDVSVAYAGGSHGRTTRNGRDLALQHISFQVESGQRVAVIGPNGAGKSTLLHLIAGTIQPTSGQIRIFGSGPGKHICIAYVPQRSQIDWSFPVTATDVVMMGRAGQIGLLRRPSRQDKQIVQESLARVNALPLAHKQIGELSGGQQQRIFIARALAQEAELLLLDEPLTGLDTPSQEMIFTILESLRPDGVTVLMATHDLALAAEHFDQIMLLNQAVVAFGSPTVVLTPDNLLHAYGGRMSALMQAVAPTRTTT
ncbi:MAG: metal ABC transporter ATP-binding protein [Anaerolineae bacterium]|nr:metal ABC transporter ATP-binding protein [Anaerolineae bacterium]